MNITLFKWWVCPCSRVIIAMAADDITNVNFGGLKQFLTAVGIYAAINPFITLDNIAIMCRNSIMLLLNINVI